MDRRNIIVLDNQFKKLNIKPVTMEQWEDLQELFGERGACGGCWCMWWRIKRSEFEKQKGDGNRLAMEGIIGKGVIPGLIAYVDDRPAAWCSVAPREAFPVLERSRVLKRVDDKPVWSIVCFFIAKPCRHRGLMLELIKASVEYAGKNGAGIVEGYPLEVKNKKIPDFYAYTGILSAFQKTGFREVARRSETRPIMRYYINNQQVLK